MGILSSLTNLIFRKTPIPEENPQKTVEVEKQSSQTVEQRRPLEGIEMIREKIVRLFSYFLNPEFDRKKPVPALIFKELKLLGIKLDDVIGDENLINRLWSRVTDDGDHKKSVEEVLQKILDAIDSKYREPVSV